MSWYNLFGAPQAATSAPPSVGLGTLGTSVAYSREDHTHGMPTLVNLAQPTTAADGTYTWTYPYPYPAGVVPNIGALVLAASGTTDVLNVQVDLATLNNTQAKFRVTRTALSVVSLLGLTILSLPAVIGAQKLSLRAEA